LKKSILRGLLALVKQFGLEVCRNIYSIPDDVHHLRRAVTTSLKDTGRNPPLLRSFFRRPRLAL